MRNHIKKSILIIFIVSFLFSDDLNQDYGIWEIQYYENTLSNHWGKAYIKNKDPIYGTYFGSNGITNKIKIDLFIDENYIDIKITDVETGEIITNFSKDYKIGLKHNKKIIFKTQFWAREKFCLWVRMNDDKIRIKKGLNLTKTGFFGFSGGKYKKIISLLSKGGWLHI